MIHSINGFQFNQLQVNPKNSSPCSDNYIGKMIYNGQRFVNYLGNDDDFGLQKKHKTNTNVSVQTRSEVVYGALPHIHESNTKKIVVLLESPHIQEFAPNFNTGNKRILKSGPALGNSGDRFNSQCIKVFNNNIAVLKASLSLDTAHTEYDMYFVNAIQYQCSLGTQKFNRSMRDYIFQALWNRSPNSFKDDLIDRLNILKPDLIVNACTKELRATCCNGNSIVPGLNFKGIAFLTANRHVSAWDNNTIVL